MTLHQVRPRRRHLTTAATPPARSRGSTSGGAFMPATEHAILKARILRALMRHKAECGLADDEQILISYAALLKVPAIRYAPWLYDELRGEERLDG